MEFIFENAHVRDERFFKEWAILTMYQRTSMIVVHLLIVLEFLLGSFMIAMGEREKGIGAIFLFALIEMFFVIRFFRMISLSVKREQEAAHEKPIIYTVSIAEDGKIIHKSSIGTEVEFDFDQIKYCKATKSYIFLCTQANQLIVLKKDGFLKGTLEGLLDLLRSKGLYKKKK